MMPLVALIVLLSALASASETADASTELRTCSGLVDANCSHEHCHYFHGTGWQCSRAYCATYTGGNVHIYGFCHHV